MSRKPAVQHPGIILAGELERLKMSGNALASALLVPSNRVNDILRGRRGITADTALRLGRYFPQTSATYWLDLQNRYDLELAIRANGKSIAKDVVPMR